MSPASLVTATLVTVLAAASALAQAPPPAEPATPDTAHARHLGLDLESLMFAAPRAPAPTEGVGAIGQTGTTQPLALNLDLFQLVPPGSTFMREARLAEWESWSGRQTWLMARTGALGPPGTEGRISLFAAPIPVEIGPDGQPRLALSGPWSEHWDEYSTEEKIGIVIEDAATVGILLALLGSIH